MLSNLISSALKDLTDPDMFAAALWDALAGIDLENARYQHDLTFFMIQFVHETAPPEREILETLLLRPPPNDLPDLYAPSNTETVAAVGALWRAMAQIAKRDEAKFLRRTKGFFSRSRVERFKTRHDKGESASC